LASGFAPVAPAEEIQEALPDGGNAGLAIHQVERLVEVLAPFGAALPGLPKLSQTGLHGMFSL
jgi:hypothetical protein